MSLQLPTRDWKYAEWVKYIIENQDEVFKAKPGKMLKVYYVHSNDEARDRLISKAHTKKQGDFTVLWMEYKESASGRSKKTEYWMHEKEPGLLMFFTASTIEGYEKTLRNQINNQLGLHEMWIKPDTFEGIKKFLIGEMKCGISKFWAHRNRGDKKRQQVKEDANRQVHYRTDNSKDGIQRLFELEESLGLTTFSVEYVYESNKVQITDEGLFHLKTVSHKSFDLMDIVIERIREEEKTMRLTAQSLHFNPTKLSLESEGGFLESGMIELKRELDVALAQQIIKHFKKFAFIDTRIQPGSLIFSTTVVDRQKGSVFALSATEKNIVLVPRYKTTFETFLGFYKEIVETIDEKATWKKLSEVIES